MGGTKCQRRLETLEPRVHNGKGESGAHNKWPRLAIGTHTRERDHLPKRLSGQTSGASLHATIPAVVAAYLGYQDGRLERTDPDSSW